jgi:putative membrane protein
MKDSVYYLVRVHQKPDMSFNIKNIQDYLRRNKKFVISFFALFYFVGFFGTIIPYTHGLFLKLFPWALLLSFLGVLIFQKSEFDFKTVILLIITALAGFFLEVAGTNSQLIFGSYTYGETLGIKVFNTPLMIGINWVMLVFITGSVVEPLSVSPPLKVLFASVIMVFYDFLMEFIAPVLCMWTWEGGVVPARNYVSWFIFAVILHSIFKIVRVKTQSSIAFSILSIQVAFFIFLIIYFR